MVIKLLDCSRTAERNVIKDIRRSFAVVNDILYIQRPHDYRSLRDVLKEELGVEGIFLRGFYEHSSMCFMMSDRDDPDETLVTREVIHAVWSSMPVKGDIAVWAGVTATDTSILWPMKHLIGICDRGGEYRRIRSGYGTAILC